MSKSVNPSIFLSVFVLVFSLTLLNTQADVYESVHDPKAKAFGNRVCTNPECTIVAANLINHGNEKIKPCDSFAQFTCDKYRLFRKDTPLRTTSRATNKRLDLLLKAPSTPEDKPYHTLMKTFYDKCIKKDKVKEDPSKAKTAFLAMLDEIGGWPLLNPQNWVAFDESFEEYIANIQKKHDVPILFNAEVMLNYFPVNADEHMLHLAPAEPIQMPSRNLLALVKSLGFDHPSLAADIDELYSIDTKRQELLDKTTDKTSKWAPLDVVIPEIPNFKLEKYVRHLFDGIAEVNSKTMIAFTNIEYFQKIGTLFTDKRVFANFAIASLFSTKLSASPDSLLCMAQIHELFKYPISQLYVKNHFDRSGIPNKGML